tara:strand:+ start:43 stop:162 length:120 start_codon:yes stop_codon:yes gene_type:complete
MTGSLLISKLLGIKILFPYQKEGDGNLAKEHFKKQKNEE